VKRTASGAIATTEHAWHEWQVLNVFDFLSAAEITSVQARNNSADVTTGVQAAISAAGANKTLYFPEGSYKITSTLVMSTNRTKWIGAGSVATQLYFAPTAGDTCVEFGVAGSDVVRSELRGFGFYSDDATFAKIALDVIRTSQCLIEDISINGGVVASSTQFWSGATSTGIRVRGHESTTLRDIFVAADKAVQISDAPGITIDIDHFNLHNCYLISNANPVVTIDTGINLTSVSFTGYQAWVLGTSGLKWTDTTTSVVGQALLIENLRTEQGTDATAYTIDIAHNTELQQLTLRNCIFDGARRGVKLAKCANVVFDNTTYGGVLEALNVASTVKRIQFTNAFWQAGASATLTGQRLVYGSPLNPNTAPMPSFAYYDESANTIRTSDIGGPLMEPQFTVANNGTQDLGGTAMSGMLIVCDSEGLSAIFHLTGTNHTTAEVSDPSTVYSVTAATATSTNVFWNAGSSTYRLENKRGASRNYRIHLIGSYIGFS
jgi:hypothetical protein